LETSPGYWQDKKDVKVAAQIPLEEGLNRTIAWYEKNKDKYFETGGEKLC
jgi:dTDP-D-glucose 4,6-dehydratase